MKTFTFQFFLALLLCGWGLRGTAQVAPPCNTVSIDVDMALSGSQLIVSFYPAVSANTPPCNSWNPSSILVLRWAAVGAGTNPINSLSFTTLGTFGFYEDPSTPGTGLFFDDGSGGYYYKKFLATTTSPFNLTAPGPMQQFGLNFTLIPGETTVDFEWVDASNAPLVTDPIHPLFDVKPFLSHALAIGSAGAFNNFTTPNVAFPVEWLYFDAQPVDHRQAQLTWATAKEVGNNYFQVEKSVDGRVFEALARIDGAGTTEVTQEYEYLDKYYLAPVVYYRLKQVDINGQHTFSNVVEVNFLDPSLAQLRFDVFPNPATDYVEIHSLGKIRGTYRLVLVDALGKEILEDTFIGSEGQTTLHIDNLPQGMYFIHLKGEKIQRQNYRVGRFVKK